MKMSVRNEDDVEGAPIDDTKHAQARTSLSVEDAKNVFEAMDE